MIKFFRKHNKKLLSVFMVLLMIVFLGGTALDSLLRPNMDRVVGTSRWGEITSFRHSDAEQTARILQGLGLPWQRPLGYGEPLESLDWILLIAEAEYLGTLIDIERVRSGLPDQLGIDELARSMRQKPDRILRAMAEFDTIRNTALTISGAAEPSEADVEVGAQSSLAKVKINAVMLPAAALIDEQLEFSEDEIAVQFAAYREREAGAGLDFGYYVKPKVQVQHIKIDRDTLIDLVRVVNLEKKAKDYYLERRERDAAFQRPADTAEEDVEGPVQEKLPYLTWEEGREAAEKGVRKLEATDMASRVGDWVARYVREPWLYQSRDEESGYRPVPEQVAKLGYYDNVVGRFPKSLSFPGAVTIVTTEFFSRVNAEDVPDLGPALFVSRTAGQFQVEGLGDLAFRTQAIIPKIPDERGTAASEYLAPFQTCRHTLRDANGNVFLFRVVAVEPGHIPSRVDEVRDRVVADLRLNAAYEEALLRATELSYCEDGATLRETYEKEIDLVALSETEAGRDSGYFEVPPVSLASRYQALSGVGGANTAVGVSQIRTLPTKVIEACFELADYDVKTRVFELKDRATVLVAEWVETQVASANEFASMRESFAQGLLDRRVQAVITDWLSPENIRARSHYEVVTN